MKIFYINYLGNRREFEWNKKSIQEILNKYGISIECLELVPKTYREQFDTNSFAELPDRWTRDNTTRRNVTAGSEGIAWCKEDGTEKFSSNVQPRTDYKTDCIDIDLFLRIYPKKKRELCKEEEFLGKIHNIPIEEARKGFTVGFVHDKKDYLTYFSPEKVRELWDKTFIIPS